jgi:hypothetical protein
MLESSQFCRWSGLSIRLFTAKRSQVSENARKLTILQVERAKQPYIAIICSQYHEKTALDQLIANRQTFVRYATVGK